MDQETIITALREIQTEQALQRAMIEDMYKSYRQAKMMGMAKIAAYVIFGLFAAGAVYFYYSTMIGMFSV